MIRIPRTMRAACFLVALVAAFAWTIVWPDMAAAAAPGPRPNILILYADDLGYADLGVTGNRDVATPHIDSLAADGVRFSTSYVSACVCSPSRAGLLTGRYQQRFGFDANAEGASQRLDKPKGLDLGERTFADRFKALGYATGIVGKWHLGSETPEYLPNARGFDEFYGLLPHGISGKRDHEVPVYRNADKVAVPEDHTTAFGREAEAFIGRHKAEPWLLYCAFTAVHAPHVAPEAYERRLAHVTPPARRKYLAMLACLDDAIGGILEAVRVHGLEENTVVFFASDNGGAGGANDNGGFRGAKWSLWEGGVRSPILVRWKGRIPGGRTLAGPAMQIDWLPTALSAAGVSIEPSWGLDGVDLMPLLEGRVDTLAARPLFWRFGVQYAVRQGDWKLVKATAEMPPALYDLAADPGEARDLAAREPARVAALQKLWESWNAANEPPRWTDDRWNGGERQGGKKRDRPSRKVSAAGDRRRPNVVLFLVDDMGWMDCQPNGSRFYDTPNISRLAEQGMRFTRAYAQPLCSPTRACLLTGRSAARHGITSAVGHTRPAECTLPDSGPPNQAMLYPSSKTFLDPAEYTLAEAFRDAGYRTGHFGKWHLGLTEPHWPEAQGFDVAFHCHPDAGPPNAYFSPYGVVPPGGQPASGKGKRSTIGTITDGPPGEYITDRLTDEAISFVEANRDRPFFLNLWHYGVHGPWGHKESITATLAGRTDPTGRQKNAVMASMLASVDESLGRMLDTLERLGIADDTIVVFMSDNGGNTHSMTAADKKPARRGDEDSSAESYRKWAGSEPPTNNAPLRDGKGRLYEGGVRVPLIVRFPDRVRPGATSDALVACTDIYPTLLDLVGVERDAGHVIDGVSAAPVLRGEAGAARASHVIWFPGRPHGAAVYAGTWKLIRREESHPDGKGAMRELYDLEDDLGETNNLASVMPEKVLELEAVLAAHLRDTGAIVPRPNPAFRKKPATPQAADAPRLKPNILVIMADDLGYADIPAHGGTGLKMPNLDALTRQGVRFSNGYVSSPQCSPSRCGLLTGIYNQRFGHEHNGCQRAAFDAGARTLAEHLRPSGYATAAYGKWHLGDNLDSHHPTRHGFDEAWGFQEYAEAAKTGQSGFPVPLQPANAYHAQVFATRAAAFIEAHAAQPWFIYLACHEPHVQIIPTDESDSLTRTGSDDLLRRKCLGVLHDLDAGVGIVLAQLRALSLEERTLVVFLSDNGAPIDALEVAEQAGKKRKPPKSPPPDASAASPGDDKNDDKAVNGSRNDPLRGRKGLAWEGGIRVPFVMAWKGTLPAGVVYDQPVISLDVAATALAAAGAAPLAGTKLDGVNLLPFLTGETTAAPHERLFWRYADRDLFAIREGNWKLVRSHTPTPQLFDLAADIGERTDLSAQHPDVVKRLQAAWDAWNATLEPPALDKAVARKTKATP